MPNAWTGSQYSVYRALFGLFLSSRFVMRIFEESHALPEPVLLAGAVASVALAVGKWDRIAALLLCPTLVLQLGPPRDWAPGLAPLIYSALALAHAFLPPHPFGAWDARRHPDLAGRWRMPDAIHLAAWVVMALAYAWTGCAEWVAASGNVERAFAAIRLVFAPLALVARLRPWLWATFLGAQVVSLAILGPSDLTAAFIFLHLFGFDPGWIPPRLPEHPPTLVFYDGACGLCHRAIRFLLAEDAAGLRFRFAPIDSKRFRNAIAAPGSGLENGEAIPDSVLVQCPGKAILTRAEGALEIGHQLGGIWRLLALLASGLPLPILNAGYDFVARNRHRLFSRPEGACPVLPAHLRERFIP